MNAKLANKMLGETVIFMDEMGKRHPAMIVDASSDTVVDLMLMTPGMQWAVVKSVTYSGNDRANSWYRRIKF